MSNNAVDIVGVQYYTLGIGHPRLPQKEAPPSTSFVLLQTAIPVILAPSGTVAADGTITLGTALPIIYPSAWVYLPAGAVVGGLAGLYYTTFTSTTVGSVKTNYVSPSISFSPFLPIAPVPATGSGSAYTQTTASDIAFSTLTIPANVMGTNGSLRVGSDRSHPNNANSKTFKVIFGGVTVNSTINTTSVADARPTFVKNSGAANSNFYSGFIGVSQGGATYPYSRGSINTAVDQNLTFTGQLAAATDYIVLEGFTVEVLPA